MLKSTEGWNDKYDGTSGNGTDAYSFSALPAGYRNSSGYYGREDGYTYFWCSTEDGSSFAYLMDLLYGYDNANLNLDSENYGFSVRCLKD